MNKKIISLLVSLLTATLLSGQNPLANAANKADYTLIPPFVSAGVPPLVMLIMGRNHKLYYEAYNDASDLNEDGILDVGYNPAIDYYGYFDSYKVYTYDGTANRFEPAAFTSDKKVTSVNQWSGDFLNYLTMSRMDALRKVLYGGYRSTDTSSETVLQRVYIPQDAHSWGKEYESITRDGYDISDYTPLALPGGGLRHLFASTTLSDNGDPLLRVLPDNTHRIWEWVAKERPVCDNSLESTGTNYNSYPSDHNAYEDLVLQFANASHLQGSGAPSNGRIDGSGNPFGSNDYYLTIFEGSLNISSPGTYSFAVDGDDAVEVIIDGTVVAGWYNGHGRCSCTSYNGSITLDSGTHELEFRHQERAGGDYYYLHWNGPDSGNSWAIVPASAYSGLTQTVYDVQTPSSTITDYQVRVQVGVNGLLESNCKQYPNGANKPIGLLQRNGESERMMFGLITGSYTKNTSGGVLRKNISSFTDEIDSTTGELTSVNGIIKTINNFRTVCFDYGSKSYNCNCGWITTHPLTEGQCRMWGNPIAEMMYEGLRYFAGKSTPTAAFTYSGTTDDSSLGLPLPSWNDPYDSSTGFSYCAKPFMLVISDINPSYDSDQLPGVNSNFGTFTGDVTGLDVSSEADTISSKENISGSYYIGQEGSNYDGSPSPKTITSLGDIRGLSPEEPTKEGSYYSASIAYYSRITDVNSATNDQNIITYSVGLASPLPRIEIPLGDQVITLVPFAKSVGGYGIVSTEGLFQPTNTIVDFFVEEITPTSGTFRINYEDVEQGADHDMDAIVKYEYVVNADDTITITLTSTYASGSIIQHCGYVISGTTADGTYLEVRDEDTATGGDPDYFLDTPPGVLPGGTWNDGADLPKQTSRTFTPGTSNGASLLENPLWYAAKWGGFDDTNENDLPDQDKEWDKDGNGVPDTYFYVTNPLKLEEQLNKSFADILRRTASGTAASVISSSRSGEGAIYQAIFYPEYKDELGNTVNWVGNINSYFIDAYGNMREDTNDNRTLDLDDDKIIKFDGTTVYKYSDDDGNGQLESSEETNPETTDITGIDFLWSAGDWINTITDADILTQRSYTGTSKQRFVFTFLDLDGDMVVDDTTIDNSGELLSFTHSQTALYPYIHVIPAPFEAVDSPSFLAGIIENGVVKDAAKYNSFANTQAERVIKFIRGQDQAEDSTTYSYKIPAMRSRTVNYPIDGDSTLDTWRLGDIVYSTPTVVGRPAEHYDLLYNDETYTELAKLYQNRRQVIYVGGNDGMLHAFNGGFFNAEDSKFYLGCSYNSSDKTYTFNDTGMPLGAELWAYVPKNLLSHLSWLTEIDYNTDYHVAYVDLKPRIFDAKIFTADTTTHPEGWGTVMVVGMRFGGGLIAADTNRDNKFKDATGTVNEPVFTSAYVIMDITNPEAEPKVLAELTLPDLGYTTCYPTVVPMKDKNSSDDKNDWYLVFGSGPAPAVGHLGGTSTTLSDAISTQTGKIYVLDLKWLVEHNEIKMLNSSGTPTAGIQTFADLDSNSFISDPITVDYDLDYKADALYFGTVAGDFSSGWGGKLRRIIIDNDDDTTNWTGDSVLIDLSSSVHDDSSVINGQPIVAAPAVGVDDQLNRWVFFGTGRFYNRVDVTNTTTANDQQSCYGIKENRIYDAAASEYTWDWATINSTDLLDVSEVGVIEGGASVFDTKDTITVAVADFDGLISEVVDNDGWQLDFIKNTERNLGQAALLGGLLTFTTYDPSNDACTIEGSSYLYALYYKTGTAYKESVIGTNTTTQEVKKVLALGLGLTISPNIHTGKGDGSKAFVQTSTGAIIGIQETNPLPTVSGGVYWMEKMED